MQKPAAPAPQWYMANGGPAIANPIPMAAQAWQQGQQQAMTPGPVGSSYTQNIIRQGGVPDWNAMMGMGAPTPTANNGDNTKPVPPGGKPPQGPGGGNNDPRFNLFSWQGFAGLPGVKEGDLGSVMRYYANLAAQQPRPLNMGKFFGQGSQPGQQRKGFGEV